MLKLRRISGIAIVLIVLLRMSIGWQFLYEGLWKVNEQKSSTPWSAEGFLKNAEGPFRDTFRAMTGDPDDLAWLNYDHVNGGWETWRGQFIEHYGLDEQQVASLDLLLDGPPKFNGVVRLEQLPPAVAERLKKLTVITYDPERKVLVVDGEQHIIPSEIASLQNAAPVERNEFGVVIGGDEINKQFHKALTDVVERQSKLGYREKLRAMLLGNEDRIGAVREDQKGTIDYKKVGENEKYQQALAEYHEMLGKANLDFEYRHAEFYKKRLGEMRAQLVGPVKALDDQLKEAALKIPTTTQLAAGPIPESSQMASVNKMTIWLLLVLGVMLISGTGSRIAAVAGAGMLLSFYLAYPPWPGIEPAAPGPEHSLFVNKNLIEVIALLAIAALPTGSWFGVDGIFRRMFGRRDEIITGPSRSSQTVTRESSNGDSRVESKKSTSAVST